MNQISFGVGCFHFGLKKKPPFLFEGQKYIEELKISLEKISNINNVNIYCEDEFKNYSENIIDEILI